MHLRGHQPLLWPCPGPPPQLRMESGRLYTHIMVYYYYYCYYYYYHYHYYYCYCYYYYY